MKLQNKKNINSTIHRTLKTAQLIDIFWERWLVHGIELGDLSRVKAKLISLEGWINQWESLAKEKVTMAECYEKKGLKKVSEYLYRQASLYYNLNYWIFPDRTEEKQNWYRKCLKTTYKADSLSEFKISYDSIYNDGHLCSGRICIPPNQRGCILIINPIDSSKEELFKYEMDFLKNGYVTVSFDGPGQGESFILNGLVGSGSKWEKFTLDLINFTKGKFQNLPIYLFGTSLGATWVLLGSSHPEIVKSVAVSPATKLDKMNMPNYFQDRMNNFCDLSPDKKTIPNFSEINYKSPLMVFHGKQDLMVSNAEMYELYQNITSDKQLIEFEDEGHCCNNKLDEIRKIAISWFSEKSEVIR